MIEAAIDRPQVIELTPAAAQTCDQWAKARGVTAEAMISGCVTAYLLRGARGCVNIGSLMIMRRGMGLYIQTVEDGVYLASLVEQKDTPVQEMSEGHP